MADYSSYEAWAAAEYEFQRQAAERGLPVDLEAVKARLTPENYAKAKQAYDGQQAGINAISQSGTAGIGPSNPKTMLADQGINYDPAAYGLSPDARADVNTVRSYGRQYANADPNRFSIGVENTPQARAFRTNSAGAFDASQAALAGANQANARAGDLNNSYLSGATMMAQNAALGLAPSAAESMYRNAFDQTRSLYNQAGMDAAQSARDQGNAIGMQQRGMAAAARGSGRNLAMLQAQNNTAMGQASANRQAFDAGLRRQEQLIGAGQDAANQAAAMRAQEMAQARSQYGQLAGINQQALAQNAAQAAQLAGQQQGIDAQLLAAQQRNTDILNQNAQFNAANQMGVLQGDQSTAANLTSRDASIGQGYLGMALDSGERDRNSAISYQDSVNAAQSHGLDRAANIYTGQQTMDMQRDQAAADRRERRTSAAIGAAGAGAAALLPWLMSDSRLKHDYGARKAADFRGAVDHEWEYKDPDKLDQSKLMGRGRQTGPMAQSLPEDIVEDTPDGKAVNIGKLAMRLAGAVGELQRKVK